MTAMFKDVSLYVFALGPRYKTASLVLLRCSLWWPLESRDEDWHGTGAKQASGKFPPSDFHP